MSEALKRCEYCGGLNLPLATKCEHCGGHRFKLEDPNPDKARKGRFHVESRWGLSGPAWFSGGEW